MKMHLVALLLLLTSPAVAGVRHASAFGIRSNRLGVGILSDTGLRTPLFDSEHVLLKDTYVDVGIVSQLSPATLHPGVYVEVVPLAILKLRASAQRLQYFGYFGSLSEFPDEEWAPAQLDAAEDDGRGQRTGGFLYDARANLRGKFWRIVFSFEGQASHFEVDAEAPVYEPVFDLLLAPSDELYQGRALLGFMVLGQAQTPSSLMVAFLHQAFRTTETDLSRQIPGLAVVMQPSESFWSTGRPVLAVLGGIFAEDKYKQGELFLATQRTLTFSESK